MWPYKQGPLVINGSDLTSLLVPLSHAELNRVSFIKVIFHQLWVILRIDCFGVRDLKDSDTAAVTRHYYQMFGQRETRTDWQGERGVYVVVEIFKILQRLVSWGIHHDHATVFRIYDECIVLWGVLRKNDWGDCWFIQGYLMYGLDCDFIFRRTRYFKDSQHAVSMTAQ